MSRPWALGLAGTVVSSVDHRHGFSAVEKRPEVSAERMPGASPPPTSRLRYCSGGGSAGPGAGRPAASTTDSSPAAVRSRSGLVAFLTPSKPKRRKPRAAAVPKALASQLKATVPIICLTPSLPGVQERVGTSCSHRCRVGFP